MSKKGTLTSRTLEKLGFVTSKFRSNSQPVNLEDVASKERLADSDQSQKTVNTITGGELDIPETNTSKSTFYVDSEPILTIATGGSDPLTKAPNSTTMLEKKKKVQPAGTQEYTVTDTDTIQKIAAQFDTTPSELKKLNKLISPMIFAGQVLFVPSEDYDHVRTASLTESDNHTSSNKVDPSAERPTMDLPLVKTVNGPPAKVPGHVERQLPTVIPENGLDFEIVPHKLSVDEAETLDKECMERFIKLNVKHITDGQGVVKGVLLVTPNAVMFDPDVMDPFVIENGADRYGMIAPMDLIISAAMYHDIAAMKIRNKRQEDGAMYHHKPEVYHDPHCPVHLHMQTKTTDATKDIDQSFPEEIRLKLERSLSLCSCGQDDVFKDNDDVDGLSSSGLRGGDNGAKLDLGVIGESEDTAEAILLKDMTEPEDVGAKSKHSKKGKKLSVSFSMQESDETNLSDKAKLEQGVIDEETKTVSEESINQRQELIQLESDNKASAESEHSLNDQENTDSAISVDTCDDKDVNKLVPMKDGKGDELDKPVTELSDKTDEPNGDKETRIGSIVYLPVAEDLNGQITVKSIQQTQTTLSRLSADEFKNGSNAPDSNIDQTASKPEDKTDSSSASALGSFSPTPHISAFVNYATGFFQKHSQDKDINSVKDIKEMQGSKLTDETKAKSSDVPVVGGGVIHREKRRVGKLGRNENLADVEVENAVRMDEKSNLFTVDYKLAGYGPRMSVHYQDPPLYLCLRMGTPQKHVPHNYPIESYGKRRKKAEYWFSIPREKVDHLYAFFVQWTPEIYGDEDELTAEKRGFVVIEESGQTDDDSLEILDGHFGPNSEFQKDWEIISKIEAERRQSIVYHEPLPLPDLIGVSAILDDEKISQLCQMMPGRTVGYPWTLIYSTETHGFSLKTLFRVMHNLDSPILLAVKDINDNVFGALCSCELKVSDSFYGTGETFLYTFYPEFKVFNWTGENNFFVKGNNESLSVGAGQGLFGLWFDGDIYHGRTNCCETFDNDLLTSSEDFIVKTFEAWAFIWE